MMGKPSMRCKAVNRKYVIMCLCLVTLSAIIGGVILTAYAVDNTEENTKMEPLNKKLCGFRLMRWAWRGERFEISAEYNETVIGITQSDGDVQNLLSEGYIISSIRPIVKKIIEADGSVAQKASSSIVILTKNNVGRAAVFVDLDSNKVTKIVILTTTVIDKSS